MTASTVKASFVSNITDPQVINERGQHDAKVQVSKMTVEAATTSIDEIGDVILFMPLPWNAKVHSIQLFNDDLDSNGTPTLAVDVGLYKMDRAGTVTVVDADAYASAITTLQAANTSGVEIAFEARNIDKMGRDVLGDGVATLSALPDPFQHAILGMTVTTAAATAAAGTISLCVNYTLA